MIRQLLTESLVLATLARVAGLVVAWRAISIANRTLGRLTAMIDVAPDLRISPVVLTFTLVVSLVTGIVFGLVPALQATRPALIPALKGKPPARASRSRISRGLVAQMALSIVLLVRPASSSRTSKAATTIDSGFNSDNVVAADVDPGMQAYNRARTEQFYRQSGERLRGSPGVVAVGLGDNLPLSLNSSDRGVTIPGYPPVPMKAC